MKRVLSMAVLGILLAGCQSGPKSVVKEAPKEPLAQGWHEYDRPDVGFFVSAPPDWRLNRPRPTMGATDENGVPIVVEIPNEASAEDLAKQKEKNQLLVLFDNSARPTIGEAMTQVQIWKEDVGAIDVAGAEAKLKDKIRKDGTVKRVQLPIGEAVQGRSEVQNQGGDQVVEVWYYVPNGSELWVFKFISVNSPTAFDNVADPMLKTLRINLRPLSR